MEETKKGFWSRLKNNIKKNGRNISRIVLVIICIGLIIYFMPKNKSIHYDFKSNAPWAHEQVLAEFDFDVRKSNDEIKAEQDSIRNNLVPVFQKLDAPSEIYNNIVTGAFIHGIDIKGNAPLFDILKSIYNNEYIIQDEDTAYISSKRNQPVVIYRNNINESPRPAIANFTTVSELQERLRKITADTIDITPYAHANYKCDTLLTQEELTRQINGIQPIITHIKEGQKIINRGEIVDGLNERIINTYLAEKNAKEKVKSEDNWQYILIGQAMFIIICMIVLLVYIAIYKKEILNSTNKFTFTILSATVFPAIVGIMTSHGGFSVFILPFAILPITLCLFIDHNTAFVTNMISVAMCSVMVNAPYEFLLLQLIAGSIAILSLRDLSSRSQMFKCVAITFLAYSVTYLCYEMMESAGLSNINNMMYVYFAISTVLTLFIYPLMFIIERTFGFISSVTLIELSNLNSKLLQRMSQEVPGTFQHSMQVGNLAAEAALAIGANPLEVRTGALYHDIGKLENPIYFTENQSGGISPHKRLSPIESAQVIIKHVTDGLALAEREGLPKRIREFISTHHGLSKTGYFYITYKNEHPDEEIDEKLFTYPGPRPHTKEQAVLMMADCVEAASHSIKEYTEENICKLVDNIIDARFREGELLMSPLTFQDIFTVKEVFKKRLMAIYHTRISYPTEKKKD